MKAHFLSFRRLLVLFAFTLASASLSPAGFAAPGPVAGASQVRLDTQAVPWPRINLVQVAGGLDAPVYLTHAGDGSGRLFVVEQPGQIRLIKDGALQSASFLDIRERVQFGGEEGLLGLAFPPQYAEKGHFYVYYTDNNGNNRVARFHTSQDPDRADEDSEELVLPLSHPTFGNHNGGQIAFGPDGYLYVGPGDGGGGGDPAGNAQNPASLLGKLLRIDVESGAATYSIPPGNPFAGNTAYRAEIWAVGLRNPWRFSHDRQTGDLYIADVGQGTFEEVSFQPASSPGGENYGWDIMEGPDCFGSASCDQSGLTLPVHAYPTREAGNCAITGGYVYRGQDYPALQGIYIFGDFCSGKVWGLQRDGDAWPSSLLLDTDFSVSSFGEDQAGELYLVDRGGGLYRVQVGYEFFLPVIRE